MTHSFKNTIKDIIKPILVPIHPEGWTFVTVFGVVTLLVGLFWFMFLWIGGLLTLWCYYFFRDPTRITPIEPGLVISPADGVIQSIQMASPPIELDMGATPLTRIAIFMNVFDVHVNRTPMSGVLTKMSYRPGKFFNADLDKASDENERQSYRLNVAPKIDIAFVQIAGLVARRILTEVNENDQVEVGQRIGMIRFGSRVDIYLPPDAPCLVCTGQRAIAGETVLAEIPALVPKGKKVHRLGEIR